MLDRRATKLEVKGILSSESRGAVFLAVLLLFVLYIVYFAAVWIVGQFFPVSAPALLTALDSALSGLARLPVSQWSAELSNPEAMLALLSGLGRGMQNIIIINACALCLEMAIIWPLRIASQKFHLRLVRRKEPSALLVFIGYTPRYFLRTVMLPIWTALCMAGWSIFALIITVGALALTVLLTNTSISYSALTGITSYLDIVKALGWYGLIPVAVSVFALVFLLYKGYSYSMAGMVMAERPTVGVRKSLRTSRMITRYGRWKLFVLDVSFIGWYLLVGLALALVGGVGFGLINWMGGQLSLIITLALALVVILLCTYLLYPYRTGVKAAYYVKLKRQAITVGTVGKEDFRGKRELESAEPVQA